MSSTKYLPRRIIWLVYLIAIVGLPAVYFQNPPLPVGMSQSRVVGWGAAIGICSSIAVLMLYWPLLGERKVGGKIAAIASVLGMGPFAGAAGAGLVDQSHVVKSYAVELPIIKIQKYDARRSRAKVHIATIKPVDPTYQIDILASSIRGQMIREGDCLTGMVEQGLLGGLWVQSFMAHPCSKERGPAASHVMTIGTGFASWRWHAPIDYSRIGQGQASDASLPANFTCLMRKGSWYFRCSQRTSSLGEGGEAAKD